ncbi:MAG: T9SS type A sorting domain-containing protein [Bacteroidia bacterium]
MLLRGSKKLILLGVFLITSGTHCFAQNVGDFKSNASGNYNAGATWLKCVTAGTWVGATATAPTGVAATDGAITIMAGHTVTVNVSVSADEMTVSNTAILSIPTAVTLTIANGTGTDLTINSGGIVRSFAGTGTLSISAGASVANDGTLTQTVSTAIISNSGTITNTGTFSLAVGGTANVKFLAGSFYKHSYVSTVAAAGTIPTATWNATSTCEILCCGNSGSAPSGLGQAFGHFTWNNTTQPVDVNLLGALSVATTGDFTMNSTNGFSLNWITTNAGSNGSIGGNFIMNNGNITILKVASINKGCTINVGLNYTQTGGTITLANCSGLVGGANVTNGTLSVSGTSTISGGTMYLNTGTWTSANGNGIFQSTGLVTLSGAGTIYGCSSSAVSGSGVGGTITANNGLTVNAGGTLNLNNSTTTGSGGTTTLSVSGALLTLSGGIITGASAAVAGASGCTVIVNANAGMTISSGTFNLTPGAITGGGGSGQINVSGAALTISGGTLNLNSSTAAGTTGSNGTLSVTGGVACNISGTAAVIVTSSTTTGGGGNGYFNITGATTSNFSMTAGSFDLCSTSGAGTGSGTMDIDGNMTLSGGTFSITSSTTSAASSGNGTITAGGSFSHTTAAASFTKTGSASAIATITMDNLSTAITAESTNGFTGTIVFNIDQGGGATAAKCTIASGKTFTVNSGTTLNLEDNSANTGYDLQVVSGATLKVSGIMNVNSLTTLDLLGNVISDASTGAGTFNLNLDATLITQHASGITTLATGAVGCIQVTGGRSYSSAASYTYNGTAAQVTGNGLPTTLTGTLSINNTLAPASGGVTLSQATTINTPGGLTFGGTTNGRLITTATNLITLGDDVVVTPAGGAAAKFVDGPIQKIGNDIFIFPTGDVYTATGSVSTAKWARISITTAPSSTTDAFTAEYHKVNDPCNVSQVVSPTNGAGINHVSYKEYWELTRNTGTSTPPVKLYWETGSSSTTLGSAISSTAAADLHVAECISSTWTDMGAGTVTGTAAGPGTITSTVTATYTTASTAMPFTFMTPSGVNPLPVSLISFTGHSAASVNILNWETASETNNSYFELEKSSDGTGFRKIGTVNGNGTSTEMNSYEFGDGEPLNGMNYYRLRQIDFNGNSEYSGIVAIDRSAASEVQIFPNPTTDMVNIISSKEIASVIVYNELGEAVFTGSNGSTFTFRPVADGIYTVKIFSRDGKSSCCRFVKK